jgi:hypothetical protein
MSVMGVMSGTFPDTYGVFYVTINSWRVRGPSRHRHGERHRRNTLPKLLPRYRDGDDAHDADIRAYSRQGMRLYFVGPYPFNLTRRTRRRYPTRRALPRLRGSRGSLLQGPTWQHPLDSQEAGYLIALGARLFSQRYGRGPLRGSIAPLPSWDFFTKVV